MKILRKTFQMLALCQECKLALGGNVPTKYIVTCYHDNQKFIELTFELF